MKWASRQIFVIVNIPGFESLYILFVPRLIRPSIKPLGCKWDAVWNSYRYCSSCNKKSHIVPGNKWQACTFVYWHMFTAMNLTGATLKVKYYFIYTTVLLYPRIWLVRTCRLIYHLSYLMLLKEKHIIIDMVVFSVTKRLSDIYGRSHKCQHFVPVGKISFMERGLCDFQFLGNMTVVFFFFCITILKRAVLKKKEKLVRDWLCTNVTP